MGELVCGCCLWLCCLRRGGGFVHWPPLPAWLALAPKIGVLFAQAVWRDALPDSPYILAADNSNKRPTVLVKFVKTIDNEGGIISGAGTIRGTVINAGQVNPGARELPGILTVTGDYTQTAAGILNVQIGGRELGQYDQLAITGQATLDGTCNVSLINHFQPDPLHDGFRVLTCGTRSGNFANINGLTLGNGLYLYPEYDDTSLTLVTRSGNAPQAEWT